MEEKIQLSHPEGKHAVRMGADKYKLMRTAILKSLTRKKAMTHGDLLILVLDHFRKNNIRFIGSVEWHLECVKLDLEAKRIITRSKEKGKQMFQLSQQKIITRPGYEKS